jgi:hypothetical protein
MSPDFRVLVIGFLFYSLGAFVALSDSMHISYWIGLVAMFVVGGLCQNFANWIRR